MSKTITICASTAFYRQANEVKDQLEAMGFTVLMPEVATLMKERNDYDVSHYTTWREDDSDYDKKQALIRKHFDKITAGDAILVLNYEKHGVDNYIGGNVLMEMGLAFYLKQPIYIINDFPAESPFLEEIKGIGSIPLHGDLQTLKSSLEQAA